MIDYTKEGALHLVTMNDGPNTICPDWQQRMLQILDTRVRHWCLVVSTSFSAMALTWKN